MYHQHHHHHCATKSNSVSARTWEVRRRDISEHNQSEKKKKVRHSSGQETTLEIASICNFQIASSNDIQHIKWKRQTAKWI